MFIPYWGFELEGIKLEDRSQNVVESLIDGIEDYMTLIFYYFMYKMKLV